METDSLVRWTVKVSKDTDVSLRSFLTQRGTKKGDLAPEKRISYRGYYSR
jgi:hypothetical protein